MFLNLNMARLLVLQVSQAISIPSRLPSLLALLIVAVHGQTWAVEGWERELVRNIHRTFR